MSDSTMHFPATPDDDEDNPQQPVAPEKQEEPLQLQRKAKPEVPIQRRLLFIGLGILFAAAFAGLVLVRRASDQQQAVKAQSGATGSELFGPPKQISSTDASREFTDVNQPKTQAQSAASTPDAAPNPALQKWQHDFPFVKPPDYLLHGGQTPAQTAAQPENPIGQQPPSNPNASSPTSAMDPFRRSFLPPNNNTNNNSVGDFGGGGEHRESDAEMYRRLEREARLAPTRVDVSKKNQIDGKTSSSVGGPNPGNAPAGSDLRELGEIAKSLVAAQSSALPQGTSTPAPQAHLPAPGTNGAGPSPATTPGESSSAANDVVKRMQEDTMKTWRVGSVTPFEVKAGWDIPCALKQEMDTETPGIASCQVTKPVKDTRLGIYTLIPVGSTLIGTYKTASLGNAGITRVEAIFTRIIFPDTTSMDLDALAAQDSKGEGGIRGKANNHYKAIISAAVLQTLVSTGSALLLNRTGGAQSGGLGYYPSMSQAAEAGAANSVNEVGGQLTKRAMNIPVTIHVNAGTVINFQLDRDIPFDGPYQARKPLMTGIGAGQ